LLFIEPIWAQTVAVNYPDLTLLQQAAGYVTAMNILWFFAICVDVVSIAYLFWDVISAIVEIFAAIPIQVYEVVMYALSVGAMIGGYWLSDEVREYTVLTGALLFAASMIVTALLHDLRASHLRFYTILMLVWGAVAIFYGSSLIGFIAVMAMMGVLGFSVMVTPLCYSFGFRDEDSLGKATSASIFVLIAFAFMKSIGVENPVVGVFMSGALWMGSLVGFLGLLIASSRWYQQSERGRLPYAVMQLVTLAVFVSAIMVGSIWDMHQLRGVGATFLALYLIEKPFEIHMESARAYAIIGLLVSAGIYGSIVWAKTHMDVIQPYLLF
jgi:hypothetical protein